jgi:hypothetical protein
VALQSVVVTYDGWYRAIYFTEEDEDPVNNLLRSSICRCAPLRRAAQDSVSQFGRYSERCVVS